MQDNGALLAAYQSAVQAYSSRDYAKAEALLQSVVARSPRSAGAHHLLGVCRYVTGDLIEAERSIRTALSIAEQPDFHVNLGLVLQQAGDEDGAEQAYSAGLRINPDMPSACNNLANILTRQNRHEEAVVLYRQAIALQPNYPIGHKNLGSCLMRLKRFDEAEGALRHAVKLDDTLTDSKVMLADMLVQTERFEEGFELYRSIGAWGKLQFEMRRVAAWNDLAAIDEACIRQISTAKKSSCGPWGLLQMPGATRALQLLAAHEFAVKELAELKSPPMCDSGWRPGNRLRIGYLSSDFYEHATMHLLAGVLENHDLASFDIYIFSYAPSREDAFVNRLRASALPIIDVSKLSDQGAAREIAARQIDILVDLKGYTTSARLGISALRPAPIIVNWLGYPGTLGHKRLADYIIGDPIVTPPEDAEFYSERLALMPKCYQPNDHLRPLPATASRAKAGLPETGVVFCSFNQLVKFNPQTFDIWSRLLLAVPKSVIWLLQPKSPAARSNVIREMDARGVPAERIVFAPFVSQTEHIARLQLADIALDTFPYNSHTTASDALWAGVPIVTLKGETFAGRVAASLLGTHGFPELIGQSEDEYFRIAAGLATAEQDRLALRQRLNEARAKSPLFDTRGFTRDLERLFRSIASDYVKPLEQRAKVVGIVANEPSGEEHQHYRAAFDDYRKGDLAGAAATLTRLVGDAPQFADAHHLLGVCHMLQNNLPAAEQSIKTAIGQSERADFHANLGLVFLRSGKLESAAEAYRASLGLEPGSFDACNNLANILSASKRYDEALELYQSAVRLEPRSALAHRNLGSCLFKLSQHGSAEVALRTAIELDESSHETRSKLADLYMHTEQFDQAFELYRSVGAWGWLQFGMRSSVSWNGLDVVDASYFEDLSAGRAKPTSPWFLIHMHGMTPQLEKRAASEYADRILGDLRTPPMVAQHIEPEPERRLRLGYLSSDFHSHATMHLLAGVLETHDRASFETIILSHGAEREDDCTRRLRAMALPIVNLYDMSDREAAQRIAELGIDILVDLKGHTGTARPGITALRPAPIIVNWLGHPGTLGHERLADYIIGDGVVTTPDDAQFYSERLALMPHVYQPNDRLRPLPQCASRSEANLPQNGVVFCSFNQPAKFNPPTFDIWSRLLREVADSVLWLMAPPAQATLHNIMHEFRARDVSTDRIVFARPASQREHLARLQIADLALDTFPYTSHTTASDTLWAGVPLVTQKGETFASRVAASLLTTHGFPELVTSTPDDYFTLALKLATDSDLRAKTRERLDRARMVSPLFDTALFTKNLEELYRAMLRNHSRPEAQRLRAITLKGADRS